MSGAWKLVPVEPTTAQLAAGRAAWVNDPLRLSSTLYRAMVSASAPLAGERLSEEALDAAVIAYDESRCALNIAWHGGSCPPMSPANRLSIRPMIRAAVLAALIHAPKEPDGRAAPSDVPERD